MPFVAEIDGRRIISLDLVKSEWDELRRSKPTIIMPCCGCEGMLKTITKTGTQFFSHKPSASINCNYKSESRQHLAIKEQVYRTVESIASRVEIEYSVDGGEARPDVYAEFGGSKFAFEVQWSRITYRELLRRSARYKELDIIPIWILKRPVSLPRTGSRYGDRLSLFKKGVIANSLKNPDWTYGDYIFISISKNKDVLLKEFIAAVMRHEYQAECNLQIEFISNSLAREEERREYNLLLFKRYEFNKRELVRKLIVNCFNRAKECRTHLKGDLPLHEKISFIRVYTEEYNSIIPDLDPTSVFYPPYFGPDFIRPHPNDSEALFRDLIVAILYEFKFWALNHDLNDKRSCEDFLKYFRSHKLMDFPFRMYNLS